MPQTHPIEPISFGRALFMIIGIAVAITFLAWNFITIRPDQETVVPPAPSGPQLPKTVTIKEGGYIIYDHASVKDVMQAIAYIYTIPVEHQGKLPETTLSGAVNPKLSIERMIKLLENNGIRIEYDGSIMTFVGDKSP